MIRFLILALAIASSPIAAADVTGTVGSINFQAPTQNVDGSALTDLAGFNVYAGLACGSFSFSHQVADPTATSTGPLAFTLASTGPIAAGDQVQVCVAMTAYDSRGNESGFSNFETRQFTAVDDIAPGAPIVITVTIEISCPPGLTCVLE